MSGDASFELHAAECLWSLPRGNAVSDCSAASPVGSYLTTQMRVSRVWVVAPDDRHRVERS